MSPLPSEYTLTIFTPTYNRANLLPRLFESIKAQVRQDDPVEWLVIDDGSSDNTKDVLEGFVHERPDLVRYTRVENGGKHRAINLAATMARGEWVMIVDSDDRVVHGAVAQILDKVRCVRDEARIGMLRALRRFPQIEKVYHFNVQRNPCHHEEWLLVQRPFDTAEVIRRSALQGHPFPDFPGERFMAESWLWHQLSRKYLTWFINCQWIECYYQAEGLSANSRRIRAASPCGAMEVYTAVLESKLPFRYHARASINWWRYRFHAGRQRKLIRTPYQVPITYAPIGWFMFLSDQCIEGG